MTLSREEILAMEQGWDLDKLVAEKVMGWTLSVNQTNWMEGHQFTAVVSTWQPSSHLSAAWQVVEKLRSKNWEFVIASEAEKVDVTFYWDPHRMEGALFDCDMPEAICKAALLAVLDL